MALMLLFKLVALLHGLCVYRSAPASPSHMSGAFTPDSMSREGSPVPEDEMSQQQSMVMPTSVAHKSQPMLPPMATDLRTSQSAPGSPSAQIYQGKQAYNAHILRKLSA